MQLAVLGLNHNTAPVELREILAAEGEKLGSLYKALLQNDRIYESVIISTCNRVEYYIVTDDYLCNIESILEVVSRICNIEKQELKKHSYVHCGSDTVKHIFRVAAGLDSLVLGEPQIFGQVKQAFLSARANEGVSDFLNKLEQFLIKTTKKVRTDTGIGDNPVSVSYAAVELAGKIFGQLDNKTALIIGAGEMCELAARHLKTAGIGKIIVTNRTLEKAQNLAREIEGETVEFSSFHETIHEADIIISSTGAPEYVVRAEHMKNIMKKRKFEPMFMIDIAVPRDIDPAINDFENIYVYDIDDLKTVVESNRKLREKEAVKAEEMIVTGVENFYNWVESMKIVPVIKGMRNYFDELKEAELKRYCDKMKITDAEQQKALGYLLSSYMNKVLHQPLTNLKHHGTDKSKYSVSEAIKLLFDIKE